MQPGAHTLPDSIAESLFLRRIFGGFRASRPYISTQSFAFGEIGIVRGDDGGAIVVIPRIEDQADRIPNPFRGLDRAQSIENQHLALKNGSKHVQLSRSDRIVI